MKVLEDVFKEPFFAKVIIRSICITKFVMGIEIENLILHTLFLSQLMSFVESERASKTVYPPGKNQRGVVTSYY